MLVKQKAADSAAAGSAFLAGTTWIADLAAYLQIAATIVAIAAGAAAALYHFERWRALRKQRQEDE